MIAESFAVESPAAIFASHLRHVPEVSMSRWSDEEARTTPKAIVTPRNSIMTAVAAPMRPYTVM